MNRRALLAAAAVALIVPGGISAAETPIPTVSTRTNPEIWVYGHQRRTPALDNAQLRRDGDLLRFHQIDYRYWKRTMPPEWTVSLRCAYRLEGLFSEREESTFDTLEGGRWYGYLALNDADHTHQGYGVYLFDDQLDPTGSDQDFNRWVSPELNKWEARHGE